MKINKDVIIRLIVLLITFVNAFLVAIGKNPLPFSSDETYFILSGLAVTGVTIWTTWKNNSFTVEAKTADKIMIALKNGEKTLEEVNEFLDSVMAEKK